MSTIINNGYGLPPHKDLASLLAWTEGVRERLTQCAKEYLQERALRLAVAKFDEATLFSQDYPLQMQPENLEDGCLSHAMRSIREEVEDARKEGRRCSLEPKTDLAIIPDGDDLYGLLYYEIPKVQEAFENEPGVKGYTYSNQTDGPKDMTHEQWSARGDHWDRLLGPTGVPAHVSTTVNLVSDLLIHRLDFPSDDTVVQALSSEKALRRRAEHLALHTAAARLPDDMQAEYEKSKGLGIWMRHHMNLLDGKVPEFNQQVQAISSLLLPAPTVGQLRQPFPGSSDPG